MLMPIGRFAALTGLSVRALRRYDELGVLRPARVETATGYRWYAPEQVPTALRIRRLRSLDLPLSEVGRVVGGDDERAILSAHLERIETRVANDMAIAHELRRLIAGDDTTVPDDVLYRIEVKTIPAQHVAVIAARVPAADARRWLTAAFAELFAHAADQGVGPPFAMRPAPDEEEMVELQAALPVTAGVEGHGRITVRHEPQCRALVALHRGPYDQLPRVHRAMWTAISEQEVRPIGEPREIYLSDPAEIGDPDHYLTEVVWPIDVTADWRPDDKLFTQPVEAGSRPDRG